MYTTVFYFQTLKEKHYVYKFKINICIMYVVLIGDTYLVLSYGKPIFIQTKNCYQLIISIYIINKHTRLYLL